MLGLGEPDREALAFPFDLLLNVDSALLLFASGRGGAADGRWFAAAGIVDVTLVDWDEATLQPMIEQAPPTWRAIRADVHGFFDESRPPVDHVSADPPSHLAPEIIESIPTWLSVARKSATTTVYRHCFAGEPGLDAPELADPPGGWRHTDLIRRSDFRGGIYWLVSTREDA